jgi:kanamycin kinase
VAFLQRDHGYVTQRIAAEIPTGPVLVPDVVRELAGDSPITPVWQNELGGLTFRLDGPRTRYAKWVATGTPEIDLAAEAERLAWAGQWVPVPAVIEHGSDADGAWLVTAAVPGQSAVDARWVADPATAAAGIGRGLRLLHDALPVDGCPFDWSVERRLVRADVRIADGEFPQDWSPEHRHLDLAEARARLGDPPEIDRLVVCHGDACVPNTLLHDDGSFAAHVDLGSLGLADRWADLAVGAWSLDWNYGNGYEGHLYAAYGIEPDHERIAYYRLLWDMA